MKYSVQNKFGEVFGFFEVPQTDPPLAPEKYAERLKSLLADNPLIDDIEVAPLAGLGEDGNYQNVGKVVVNINPDTIIGLHSLDDVHAAVGMVSLMHELGED